MNIIFSPTWWVFGSQRSTLGPVGLYWALRVSRAPRSSLPTVKYRAKVLCTVEIDMQERISKSI